MWKARDTPLGRIVAIKKEQLDNALEFDPHYTTAHMYLGFVHILTGEFDKGIRTIETG